MAILFPGRARRSAPPRRDTCAVVHARAPPTWPVEPPPHITARWSHLNPQFSAQHEGREVQVLQTGGAGYQHLDKQGFRLAQTRISY